MALSKVGGAGAVCVWREQHYFHNLKIMVVQLTSQVQCLAGSTSSGIAHSTLVPP